MYKYLIGAILIITLIIKTLGIEMDTPAIVWTLGVCALGIIEAIERITDK